MLGEEPELDASLSRLRFQVSEKDILDEKGLFKRDGASSGRGRMGVLKKKKTKEKTPSIASAFTAPSLEEETGQIY